MPATFSPADKERITASLTRLINDVISPSYKNLADFLQAEYLPKSLASISLETLPKGADGCIII